jgi:hypothetical protein
MTAQKHDLALGAPPRLREGQRAHLGDLPVHHAGELVHHCLRRGFAHQPGQVGPEALPVAQDGVRPQPRRHTAQAHGGQRPSDRVEVALGLDGVNDWLVGRPSRGVNRAVEDLSPQAGLAGAAGADDDANLPALGPVRAVNGQVGLQPEVAGVVNVEERPHASGAVGLKVPAGVVDGDFHTLTTFTLWSAACSWA